LTAAAATGLGVRTSLAEEAGIQGTNDRFVVTSLGIDAPVNLRIVGPDGSMGDPAGKDDVVRYDFSSIAGLGGTPGLGGTVVVAGHVDYRPNLLAVFWPLRSAEVGTRIDYYRGDGAVVSYVVDWIAKVAGDQDVAEYFVSSSPESMVLISCEGTFDASTRHYDSRTFVHAVRLS
ncbi:MAG TPA: class F sortase, partial [Dehalococcoidia bacterium]|nr:class F sortase [Dehalococcoidia bacterium]